MAKLARLGRRHEALNPRVRTVSLGGTGDFSRNIRISGGGTSRATSIRQSPALEQWIMEIRCRGYDTLIPQQLFRERKKINFYFPVTW